MPALRLLSSCLRPLQIILSKDNNQDYLSLYPGTVGGVFPKIEGQFLWAMPSDGSGGYLLYPRMQITSPSEGSILQIWLKVRCVAGAVVEVLVETGSDMPPNSIEYAYILLGYITQSGSSVQIAYGNMNYILAYELLSDGSNASHPFTHNFTPAP